MPDHQKLNQKKINIFATTEINMRIMPKTALSADIAWMTGQDVVMLKVHQQVFASPGAKGGGAPRDIGLFMTKEYLSGVAG